MLTANVAIKLARIEMNSTFEEGPGIPVDKTGKSDFLKGKFSQGKAPEQKRHSVFRAMNREISDDENDMMKREFRKKFTLAKIFCDGRLR